MKNIIKAVPYIETRGSERFKEFLQTPFEKEHVSWFTWAGEIKFDGDSYTFNDVHKFPLPSKINEFISDMKRINVNLEWKPEVIEDFEPQDYLPEKEIGKYYKNLLNKMEKGHELNGNE